MTHNLSQTERILALLRERGRLGLTPKEALAEVGTMRLAARIADLRAAGHLISTETFTTPNRARVARYVLRNHPMGLFATQEDYAAWHKMTEAEKREAWGK